MKRGEDGRGVEVAIKIQHPVLDSQSLVDIRVCEGLVGLAAWIFPDFAFGWLAEELTTSLPKELDFVSEGMNAGIVAKNFERVPMVCLLLLQFVIFFC